ncbi:MAG: acyl transferase [Pseudopedobacter saltans]|uniref:Acyl transferase n=1 Tax=Pseudopedobacter saltans TaxID=151895 RepID=A0A2W5G680_9SPHI|nr:MAG: acyl transferase [Pseudopedobacter saltans]
MQEVDNRYFEQIFSGKIVSDEVILELFRFQYKNNQVYHAWCNALNRPVETVKNVEEIPFLPISFFKTHRVVCGEFEPELIFESSGTTQTINSQHLIKYASIYEESFQKGFELFYGDPKDWCILGLLPAYLERKNSSLVKMANDLIELSHHPKSGFYLYDFEKLHQTLQELEAVGQKTLLLGVTFALLDFAEAFPIDLKQTIVMETGGMKGRKKEMTRQEVHDYLHKQLGISHVHSEYGMTELLSQAYSKGEGRYHCPPWMRVYLRDENDPLTIKKIGQGLVNVIDLANIYSVSFIATDDVGVMHQDNSFEIQGRLDNSDLRGCSLLVL